VVVTNTARWQLSTDAAELYEQVLVPAMFAPWGRDLLGLADPHPGERVLDVACGTGLVARLAAESVGPKGAVTALDLNPAMLRVAQTLAAPAGARITWLEGNVEAMPLPDAAFDLLLCQQGIQYFPDRPRALADMLRVLKPGARAVLSVWQGDTAYTRAVADAMEAAMGRKAGNSMRRVLACPPTAMVAKEMREAGFRDVTVHAHTQLREIPDVRTYVFRHLGATPHADAITRLDEEQRRRILEHVIAALEPVRHGTGIRYPETASLLVGYR
jgi:ubiquinone/menaquinone biosynthesis C-methylase UbiE